MRPPRIAILVLFTSASLFLLARSISSRRRSSSGPTISTTSTTETSSPLRSFFSFTAPFSLFPPNAVISLTDDNSTFFPARPAAFGPSFPSKGLSGQLWIGSGFEDSLPDGEGEGELGCSDVPGWEGGAPHPALKPNEPAASSDKSAGAAAGIANNAKRDDSPPGPAVDRKASSEKPVQAAPPVDDGTDDYLHRGLTPAKSTHHESTGSAASHSDIQVIQETAEITGKVVLLSRGGCGFLEKTKWAQRRGAIALIVGDNQKGGPLIQMFARGNTDNVTIPSVFTSRTTAHLLSSLVQPGYFDLFNENGHAVQKGQYGDMNRKNKKTGTETTSTTLTTVATAVPKSGARASLSGNSLATPKGEDASPKQPRGNWITRLFSWGGGDSVASERSRPPSSGRLDWVIVDDWSVEKDKQIEKSLSKASKKTGNGGAVAASESRRTQGDNFQIGVQDWRDPDLVGASAKDSKSPPVSKDAGKSTGKKTRVGMKDAPTKESTKKPAKGAAKDANGPKGGSITPSSGEYAPEVVSDERASSSRKTDAKSDSQGGIISKIFGDDDGADFTTTDAGSRSKDTVSSVPPPPHRGHPGQGEALWVTITPTGSASPFFDTLLVLVISPLITLTVVYALLILRAKIRRRRWRAPKSVVERLPVRTYHTVATSPTHSPRLPSPTSSSPTTPLLQGSSRSRPRSRTTTGVPDSNNHLRVDTSVQASRSPSRNGLEKDDKNTSSEWKKYMGRQVECVVCLEEYVDGVSQVMSLPCGHEFHAECITPWLTTRRRTCPICKGDVVRSLARGSSSSPRYEPYHDDSDEDIEATASGTLGIPVISSRDREAILQENRLAAMVPRSGRRTPPQSDGFFSAIRNGAGSGPSFRTLEEERRAREELRRRDEDNNWP